MGKIIAVGGCMALLVVISVAAYLSLQQSDTVQIDNVEISPPSQIVSSSA